MKSASIADCEPQGKRWSLSWKPDDRCGRFTREAILALAPPASGIYGLFNHDCQIFIGESDNIREMLLRLERETDFQSENLRPTGFTFEICPEESRKQKTSELIARYRPALQVIESRPLSRESRENTLETVSTGKEEPAESCLFPGERDNSLATSRVFKMKHAWWTVAMLLSAAGATAYYFDIAHMRRRDADAEPQARLAKPEVSAASRPAAAAGPRAAAARPAPAELAIKMKGDVRIAPASDAEDAGVQKISAPPAAPRSGEPSEKKWSVQIASMPERSAADSLAQDLSEKGYAAYVVTAEVKGRTYYRVRAGRFDARQDAESMRRELARQETYRESYVTND